jgi:hypothetical protein
VSHGDYVQLLARLYLAGIITAAKARCLHEAAFTRWRATTGGPLPLAARPLTLAEMLG